MKKKNNENLTPEQPYTGKTYAYIALALTALAAAAFGLTFTVLGVYSLISSVLLCLAALAFVNVQKKKNNFKQLIIIKVAAYVLFAVDIAFFVGAIIWLAINK